MARLPGMFGWSDLCQSDAVDVPALTETQRKILEIDGTLTTFIAELIGERIQIEVVAQRRETATDEMAELLHTNPGAFVTDRRVVACAERSRAAQFCAHSKLRLELLPPDFEHQLRAAPAGLGAALQAAGVDVEREMLSWSRTETPVWGTERGLPADSLTRTYRFLTSGQPFALVTEWFPATGYLQPSKQSTPVSK